MNQKQIEAVLALKGPERVKHFVEAVADCQEAWGLHDEGWASSAKDDGTFVFLPLRLD